MSATIAIQAADGSAEAYLTGETGIPGVLFYVDAIGLRPQIEQMADRIASWGYVVLAPHVFYRDGRAADLAPQADLRDPGAREAFFAGGVMERVGALTPDLSVPDADALVATLGKYAGRVRSVLPATAWVRASPYARPVSSPARSRRSVASTVPAWSRTARTARTWRSPGRPPPTSSAMPTRTAR